MGEKEWIILQQNHAHAAALATVFKIPLFLADILINRGFKTPEEVETFFHPDQKALLDPFLLKDMDKAVSRISRAIEQKEIVAVYGDYDVDGITSVSLLKRYLSAQGLQVFCYIPDRITEGYGIHNEAIDRIAKTGASLIISVDTGITACSEVEYAASLGLDFIITDHHECGESVPHAVAVCNPKQSDCPYPFKSLAGVGVVFKLICALDQRSDAELLSIYGDLVALGTVADVMPMIGENRYIVKQGLSVLAKNKAGLAALMKQSGIRNPQKISVFDISFLLAPRINAAGRIGDPMKAVQLLTQTDPNCYNDIAAYLCEKNNERQRMESEIFKQAEQIIRTRHLCDHQNVLVLWSEQWHHGVIGIVASRIKEKYGIPTILFSISGNKAKGSGRSVEPLNLYEALNGLHQSYFQFGGHAMAAGITMNVSDLPRFRDDLQQYVTDFMGKQTFVNHLIVDAVLKEDDFCENAFESISRLEPFGNKNEAPLFCVRSAVIKNITPIGGRRHTRLLFAIGKKRVSAVYFGVSVDALGYARDESVDVLFQAAINEYCGRREIQMIVKAIRPFENKYYALISDVSDALLQKFEGRVCTRSEIAAVYRFCRHALRAQMALPEYILLPNLMKQLGFGSVSLFQFTVSLMILKEIGILEYAVAQQRLLLLQIHDEKRVLLDHSDIYRKISV